jgi:hypothetical protein
MKIQSLLIANRGEITCRIIRTAKILPGTGRGTASWRWRGRVRLGSFFDICVLASTGPSTARAVPLPVPGRIL